MATSDEDILVFLDFARGHLDVNALGQDWEQDLVESVRNLRRTSIQRSLRRGLAKSLLGQLTAADYERTTSWNFDTDSELRAHLNMCWRLLYGSDDPAESV